jgi:D-arginine dehydrogenase
MVMDVAGRWYAEPETGGLLISPADETPVEPDEPDAARPEEIDIALGLERAGAALGLPLRTVRRAWAGLRTFAPDEVPVVGPDPGDPGFIWLAGQGGGGIKTAPALADVVAGAILNGAAVPPALSADRFRSAG